MYSLRQLSWRNTSNRYVYVLLAWLWFPPYSFVVQIQIQADHVPVVQGFAAHLLLVWCHLQVLRSIKQLIERFIVAQELLETLGVMDTGFVYLLSLAGVVVIAHIVGPSKEAFVLHA